MTVIPYQWTLERYHQAIDAGLFADQSIELLRGEIIVVPPEREPHAYYCSEVGDYLRALFGHRAKIREAHPITLPNNSEPLPDLAIVQPLGTVLGTVYSKRHPEPNDIFWLIKFSNVTLSYDLTVKRAIYAEAGIPEYWVVNLNTQELKVFRDPKNGDYASEQTYTSGVLTPVTFADVEISVQRLLNP